ncbi:ribonuclease R [Mycoplasma marinum]|uniref:ribonuclease R n=1 Tax=Mycoplasma marinum TaxID=1937190 RepID=UPI003B2C2079
MDKKLLFKVLDENPKSFNWLARKLNIERGENKLFSSFLNILVSKGEIFTTRQREYFRPIFLGEYEGVIRMTSKGFGFVDREEDSIFIGPGSTNGAFDKDDVIVKLFQDPTKPDGYNGFVSKIVNRYHTEIVGTVKKFGPHIIGFEPLDDRLSGKFRFTSTEGLKENFRVKVKIVEYGDSITKIEPILIIGHKDDAKVDIQSAIENSGIPYLWSDKVMKETNHDIPDTIDNESKDGREDIRDRLIITIDGDDTKDFDDAVEIRKLSNGNYLLGVHIADVTHYVKEGSAIDDEALVRGTSVYLADRVIPMLPEKLSNGICSLNPNVDRFVLSCDMEINTKGETVNHRVYPAIIKSKHRLTYNEVNEYYAGTKNFEDKNLESLLNDALELTKILRRYKLREGYIDFEIEESKLILDENGKTINIIPRPRGESEMMIEDLMVRANETVAYHASKAKVPFIYRIHDKPDMEKIAALQQVVSVLALDVHIPQEPEPKEFAKAINDLKKYRFDDFMKIMMLRTMQKAIYDKNNIGHFGLASKFYTHFTSPIRRYPDLMVHRMLREYFFEGRMELKDHFDSILDNIAKENSLSEQKAMELERKVADIKKAEYYTKFIGKKLEGQIVSMQKFGFFVEFKDKVDGLVHVSSLTDGKYELAKTGLQISNGKRSFTIGEQVEVIVVQTSKEEGKIDLVLADLADKQNPKPAPQRRRYGKGNSKK